MGRFSKTSQAVCSLPAGSTHLQNSSEVAGWRHCPYPAVSCQAQYPANLVLVVSLSMIFFWFLSCLSHFLFPVLFLEKLNLNLIVLYRQIRSVWYSVIHDYPWFMIHIFWYISIVAERIFPPYVGIGGMRRDHVTTVGCLGSCFARNRMLGIARVLESNGCMISSSIVVQYFTDLWRVD